MATRTITGIHHLTAIAGDPQRNLDFYTAVLGLRLVKLTVNFDDPGTYHFYFGNDAGAPGSILTFFPWLGIRRGIVGSGQVTATGRSAMKRRSGEKFALAVLRAVKVGGRKALRFPRRMD